MNSSLSGFKAKPIAYKAKPIAYKAKPIAYKAKPIAYKAKPIAYRPQATLFFVFSFGESVYNSFKITLASTK